QRHLADFLAGDLPAVGQLLELLAGRRGILLGDPVVGAAQLAVAVAREAVAEDAALRGELAHRGLAVARAELVDEVVPQDGDRLRPADRRRRWRNRIDFRSRLEEEFCHGRLSSVLGTRSATRNSWPVRGITCACDECHRPMFCRGLYSRACLNP